MSISLSRNKSHAHDFPISTLTSTTPGIQADIVKVGLVYGRGSSDEAPEKNGVAHLSEHLMFRDFSKAEEGSIAEVCDIKGIELDAYTSREHSMFWVTTDRTQLKTGLDMLSSVVKLRETSEENIANELGVVRAEIASVYQDKHELLYELFHSASMKGNLSHPVIGTEQSIQHLTKSDVYKWRQDSMDCVDGLVVVSDKPRATVEAVVAHPIAKKFKVREKPKRESDYTPSCLTYKWDDVNQEGSQAPVTNKGDSNSDTVTVLLALPFDTRNIPISLLMELNSNFIGVTRTTERMGEMGIDDIRSRVVQYDQISFLLLSFSGSDGSVPMFYDEFPSLLSQALLSGQGKTRWKVLQDASCVGDVGLSFLAQLTQTDREQSVDLIRKRNRMINVHQKLETVLQSLRECSIMMLQPNRHGVVVEGENKIFKGIGRGQAFAHPFSTNRPL